MQKNELMVFIELEAKSHGFDVDTWKLFVREERVVSDFAAEIIGLFEEGDRQAAIALHDQLNWHERKVARQEIGQQISQQINQQINQQISQDRLIAELLSDGPSLNELDEKETDALFCEATQITIKTHPHYGECLFYRCPHCRKRIITERREINCTIFTHGVTRTGQVNQHLNEQAATAMKNSCQVIDGCMRQYELIFRGSYYVASPCTGK